MAVVNGTNSCIRKPIQASSVNGKGFLKSPDCQGTSIPISTDDYFVVTIGEDKFAFWPNGDFIGNNPLLRSDKHIPRHIDGHSITLDVVIYDNKNKPVCIIRGSNVFNPQGKIMGRLVEDNVKSNDIFVKRSYIIYDNNNKKVGRLFSTETIEIMKFDLALDGVTERFHGKIDEEYSIFMPDNQGRSCSELNAVLSKENLTIRLEEGNIGLDELKGYVKALNLSDMCLYPDEDVRAAFVQLKKKLQTELLQAYFREGEEVDITLLPDIQISGKLEVNSNIKDRIPPGFQITYEFSIAMDPSRTKFALYDENGSLINTVEPQWSNCGRTATLPWSASRLKWSANYTLRLEGESLNHQKIAQKAGFRTIDDPVPVYKRSYTTAENPNISGEMRKLIEKGQEVVFLVAIGADLEDGKGLEKELLYKLKKYLGTKAGKGIVTDHYDARQKYHTISATIPSQYGPMRIKIVVTGVDTVNSRRLFVDAQRNENCVGIIYDGHSKGGAGFMLRDAFANIDLGYDLLANSERPFTFIHLGCESAPLYGRRFHEKLPNAEIILSTKRTFTDPNVEAGLIEDFLEFRSWEEIEESWAEKELDFLVGPYAGGEKGIEMSQYTNADDDDMPDIGDVAYDGPDWERSSNGILLEASTLAHYWLKSDYDISNYVMSNIRPQNCRFGIPDNNGPITIRESVQGGQIEIIVNSNLRSADKEVLAGCILFSLYVHAKKKISGPTQNVENYVMALKILANDWSFIKEKPEEEKNELLQEILTTLGFNGAPSNFKDYAVFRNYFGQRMFSQPSSLGIGFNNNANPLHQLSQMVS